MMQGYWYDYAKQKYGDNARLSYTDADNFKFRVKLKDVCAGLAVDSLRQDSVHQIGN